MAESANRSAEIIVVSPESPWPTVHGGRLRTARVAEHLSERFRVTVVCPYDPDAGQPPHGIGLVQVNAAPHTALTGRLSARPRLGLVFGQPLIDTVRRQITHRQTVVLWAHTYMAAVGMAAIGDLAFHIIDVPNIERDRFRSIAGTRQPHLRIPLSLEALKADHWEPHVVTSADAVVALTVDDAHRLRQDEARVLLAPNGFEKRPYSPSPRHSGPILFVANWAYEPNRRSLEDFLRSVWPRVILSLDTASLRIIGTGGQALIDESGAPNVEALGFVEDLGPHYRSSRLVLAPARSGGGSQLKVSEALSHGRIVVGSPHLNSRGGGSSTSEFVVGVDDMAHQIVSLLRNWEDRHRRELAAVDYTSERGWAQTLHPISEVVSSLTGRATS